LKSDLKLKTESSILMKTKRSNPILYTNPSEYNSYKDDSERLSIIIRD
jgi:hypothetical protein